MTHEYGKPLLGMALGDQHLFPDDVSAGEEPWQPLEPEPTTVLWRYMSFAKYCSLLEQQSLFFSLVQKLQKEEDRYEGFICPPPRRHKGDRLIRAEHLGREVLLKVVQANLVNCWVNSEHESSLMWKSYAGTEGVAIRTTFRDLQESIHSLNPELPVTFGKIDYVDYRQRTTPRFRWAPLFISEWNSAERRRCVRSCPVRHGMFALIQAVRTIPSLTLRSTRMLPSGEAGIFR